jgi:hypothetical protein
MRRRSPYLATGLAALAGLGVAAPASAAIVELGQTAQPPAPSCPADPCFAAARTTGYQAKAGDQRGLYVVPQKGRIVAWSIALSDPGARRIAGFEKQFGGAASAGISVLRPGRKQYARTLKSSPVVRLEPFFGQTVQFPLERTLGVEKGWIVALTVPTWAPSLAVGFGNDHSWRAASRRDGDCKDLETQSPQKVGSIARYRCLFRTARLTYTATLVTEPAAPAR